MIKKTEDLHRQWRQGGGGKNINNGGYLNVASIIIH